MKNTNNNYEEVVNNIKNWIIENRGCCNDYLFRMIELIGATIVGVKPAELINLSRIDSVCKEKCIRNYKECILCNDNIRMIYFKNKHDKEQIFVYNIEALDVYLKNKTAQKILKDIGYPEEYSTTKYVNHLIKKLRTEDFPHEIGLFLGYPLKDVIGFMEIAPLKLIKVNGWKVYGSERQSDIQYNNFANARNDLKEVIIKCFSNKTA